MRIIGIDPSLTATGIALIDTDHPDRTYTTTAKSKPNGTSPFDRLHRFDTAANAILETLGGHIDLAVIEAPSYGSQGAGTWDRAGLWWNTIRILKRLDIATIEVPPAVRCKYATGRGNADKDVVMLSAARRYPHAPIEDNNQADAVILAAIGARLTGHPIDDPLPKINLTGGYAKLATAFNHEQVTA